MNMRHETKMAYSVKQCADTLGLSEKSIRRLIDKGELRASRPLGRILIPADSLVDLLERHEIQAQGDCIEHE